MCHSILIGIAFIIIPFQWEPEKPHGWYNSEIYIKTKKINKIERRKKFEKIINVSIGSNPYNGNCCM
jgi:hypothetical protein